jgi:hypothetical protein
MRALLGPLCRSRLPLPAARIRHFILVVSVTADEAFNHLKCLIVGELARRMLEEIGGWRAECPPFATL